MEKLLNFDVTVHRANPDFVPGDTYSYQLADGMRESRSAENIAYTAYVRNGIALVSTRMLTQDYKGVKIVRQQGEHFGSIGDVYSLNGIKFLVVDVLDFGRKYKSVPLTAFLAPFAGALYLQYHWKTKVYHTYIAALIKHRLMIRDPLTFKAPGLSDYFFVRDKQITELSKELAQTRTTLDKVAKERDQQQLRALGAEQREEKLRSALGFVRDVAREHV